MVLNTCRKTPNKIKKETTKIQTRKKKKMLLQVETVDRLQTGGRPLLGILQNME